MSPTPSCVLPRLAGETVCGPLIAPALAGETQRGQADER